MANKPSLIKWALLVIAVCVLLVIVFILLLPPSGKHQEPVDYVAEYNKINKPADFDPNDNAAAYFDKAFELMVNEPNDFEQIRKLWPADMNDDQLQTVKHWVEANKQTIDYIKQAVSKTYYWKPLEADANKPLMLADLNDLSKLRKATYLLCLDARLTANNGQTGHALQQLADIYKMGTYLTGPKFVICQLVGIAISGLAVQSAFQILENTNPSTAILADFKKRITSLSREKPFLMDFAAERLIFHDEVKHLFAGSRYFGFFDTTGLKLKMLFLRTVGRPWRAREKRKADLMYDYFDTARLKTPWQLHSEGNDVNIITERMAKGTLFLRILIPAFDKVLRISYRAQANTDALIATIAILQYKAETDRYPQDIKELVTAGYLEKLPMDPFSSGALTYKVTGDNFILYSLAQDFDDDGGKHDANWAEKGNGDFVFWPVQKSK